MDTTERQLLADAIRRTFPTITASRDPAWSRPAALRVIDAVLSLNRNYDSFLVPRLDAFQANFPDVRSVAELHDMLASFEDPHAFLKQTMRYDDRARAATLAGVVAYLLKEVSANAPETDALRNWAEEAKPEDYKKMGVRGFGLAGFQYLRMLFGANTTKPDVHVLRFVSEALGRPVSDVEGLRLLEEAAGSWGLSLRDLDTSIWERSARATSGA